MQKKILTEQRLRIYKNLSEMNKHRVSYSTLLMYLAS